MENGIDITQSETQSINYMVTIYFCQLGQESYSLKILVTLKVK